MANFPQLKMTSAGRDLQAKAQTGQLLKFSRVGLGDGELEGELAALTGLVAEKQSLSIRDQSTPGDGTSILQVIATNKGLAKGFNIRELGLFAFDPDTGAEVLYSYTNAANESDFLPAEGGAVTWEGLFDLVTVVGNAENVTAVIDDYITIALKSEVNALKPYILPTGGLVDDILVKASNRDGESKWLTLTLAGLQMRFGSVEEMRVATDQQTVFTLEKTLTNGLGVYVEGRRINRGIDWTALSAKQLQMTSPLAAGARVLFVNNEEVSASAAIDVTLDGPALVYAGSSNTFTITNFDSSSTYEVATSVGTITRAKDVLTLVIPAGQAAGTLDLSVTRDGVKKNRKVAIGAAAIMAPQITSPFNGATGVSFEPNIVASSFTVYPADYDTHVQTRWQIATASTFAAGSLVLDLTTADHLTAIALTSIAKRLDPAKRYYVRAQYVGQSLTGSWSSTVYFNTAAIYVRKPSVVSPMDGADKVSLSFTFQASAFSVAGGADEHLASRWQLSLYPDFRNVVEDTGWSTTQLVQYKPVAAMLKGTPHYVRMAQKGKTAGESEWSATVSFSTAAPLAGTVTALTSGGSPRRDLTVTGLAGALWALGGYSEGGGIAVGKHFFRYDLESGLWQQKAPPPTNLMRHAAVAASGKLYVFGGSDNGGSNLLGSLLCYDPVDNSWAALQPGPDPRAFAWMVEHEGFIYIGGGQGKKNNTTVNLVDIWRYNIQLNTWSQMSAPPSASMYGIAGAADGKIYVLPGTQRFAKIQIYDIATDKWSEGAQSIYSICWSAGAMVSGLFYTMGGVDGGSGAPRNYQSMQEYDPATNVWRALPDFPSPRYDHAGCEYEGVLYFHAGATGSNVQLNTLHRVT